LAGNTSNQVGVCHQVQASKASKTQPLKSEITVLVASYFLQGGGA